MKYVIWKDKIYMPSIKNDGVEELQIPLEHLRVQTGANETLDKEVYPIPTSSRVIEIVTELKNTVFQTKYTALLSNGETVLPSAAEFNDVYTSDGEVIVVKDLDGKTIYLTANPVDDENGVYQPQQTIAEGEGILVILEATGVFEEAGYQNGQFLIDQTKNQLPNTIIDLTDRIVANDSALKLLNAKVVTRLDGTQETLLTTISPLATTEMFGDYTKSTDQLLKDQSQDDAINRKLDRLAIHNTDFNSDNIDERVIENREHTKDNATIIADHDTQLKAKVDVAAPFDKNFTSLINVDRIKENGSKIADGNKEIEQLKIQQNALSGEFQKQVIPADGRFPGTPARVELLLDAHGDQIIINKTISEDNKAKLAVLEPKVATLDTDKQAKKATSHTSDFNSDNMEERDYEALKAAKDADTYAQQAIAEVAAIKKTEDLATYVLEAGAELPVAASADTPITFSAVQTEDGNKYNAGADSKITSDFTAGSITLNNDDYDGKKWAITAHMIIKKTGGAATASPVINLMANGALVKAFPVSGLSATSTSHTFAIDNFIIDGADALYIGKKIVLALVINGDAYELSVNQARTFGVNEKAGGLVRTVATTDLLNANDAVAEGGITQADINKKNELVATKVLGISKPGTDTLIDSISVKAMHELLSGYAKSGTKTVIDGYNIEDTFKKLLDVEVAQPDGAGNIKLSELLAKGTLALPALPIKQSLLDRDKQKLKQVYVEAGETDEEYIDRLFDEIGPHEAFIDGYRADFNVNWSQTKVPWVASTTEGKQVWNSIRINDNLTIDFLQKVLIKPIDFDGSTVHCTLTDISTVDAYSNVGTSFTAIFNELVAAVKALDTKSASNEATIKEITNAGKIKADSATRDLTLPNVVGTLAIVKDVTDAIAAARTAIETAYKAADTALKTSIEGTYKAADTVVLNAAKAFVTTQLAGYDTKAQVDAKIAAVKIDLPVSMVLHFDDGTIQTVKVGSDGASDEPEDDGSMIISNEIPMYDNGDDA